MRHVLWAWISYALWNAIGLARNLKCKGNVSGSEDNNKAKYANLLDIKPEELSATKKFTIGFLGRTFFLT